MYPSLETIKSLAASGRFRRAPVCREILSDRFTPVEVLRTLRAASSHCYLLESAEDSRGFGRYSYLGFDPAMEITCRDGILRIRQGRDGEPPEVSEKTVSHPGPEIRRILEEYKTPVMENMPPFTGGLVGYFAYDYFKYNEPSLVNPDLTNGDFNDVDLMLFDKVIAFDNLRQKLTVIAGVSLGGDNADIETAYARAEQDIAEIIALIRSGAKAVFRPLRLLSPLDALFPEDRYVAMVEKAKHYIREGDIFQVVLSDPIVARAEGSLLDTYRVLRTLNPSPYMFYFTSDDLEMAGASPETLVKNDAGTLYNYPLAGTRPRGKTTEEDQALAASLLADAKELAEHNMLVDLGRNDIGRVSRVGSVRVEKYLNILRFSHVMHIGSTVIGELREDKDAIDAIDAILPAGTLSGAPKIRACQIISELEGRRRGVYGGAVGHIDFNGNMDTCIAIRLAYRKNGAICVQSGAGIVADSVPEKEFTECRNKAMAAAEALKIAAAPDFE
jgi:anthranilate synthase component 1